MKRDKRRTNRLVATALLCALAVTPLLFHGEALAFRGLAQGAKHGRVLVKLPAGYKNVRVGAVDYFYHRGLYYRKVPAGYLIVEAPVRKVLVGDAKAVRALIPGVVSVEVAALNVRSGPGKRHAVIGRVHRGEELPVQEEVQGWCRVILPDGFSGWVKTEFTVVTPPVPRG